MTMTLAMPTPPTSSAIAPRPSSSEVMESATSSREASASEGRLTLTVPGAAGLAARPSMLATSAVLIGLLAVNLAFDLARVVMVTDDCGVGAALSRVRLFLLADSRQVLGIFGAMSTLLLAAMVGSLAATAGLTMVGWVPIVGLLFVPLQVAFWIVRGLLFQYMSLTTLSAYQCQYRRFA